MEVSFNFQIELQEEGERWNDQKNNIPEKWTIIKIEAIYELEFLLPQKVNDNNETINFAIIKYK